MERKWVLCFAIGIGLVWDFWLCYPIFWIAWYQLMLLHQFLKFVLAKLWVIEYVDCHLHYSSISSSVHRWIVSILQELVAVLLVFCTVETISYYANMLLHLIMVVTFDPIYTNIMTRMLLSRFSSHTMPHNSSIKIELNSIVYKT